MNNAKKPGRTARRIILVALALILLCALVAVGTLWLSLQPADERGRPAYFRVRKGDALETVLERAEKESLIKSAAGVRMYSRIFKPEGRIRSGTFQVSPTVRGDAVLRALLSAEPVRQMVLIREGLWARQVAAVVEQKAVAKRGDFLDLVRSPKQFRQTLGFTVPAKTLEGYLFPDTYDLPPLLGAEEAVEKMLETFCKKLYQPLGKPDPAKLHRWVIIGSLIEMEAVKDEERAKIAGVIYNRLADGRPLQVDATIAYARGRRERLFYKDYKLDHPYNTYLHKGLPPGPICSPGAASIRAAARPAKHRYLYYVAMPDRSHRFAETYEGHRRNIMASRKAFETKRLEAHADASQTP